jgi:hypothetical protein
LHQILKFCIILKANEVDNFLADKAWSMEMLNRYPQIKNIFVKHNTAIPTSAPVERLFTLVLDLHGNTDFSMVFETRA